jgi:hypothetical protein
MAEWFAGAFTVNSQWHPRHLSMKLLSILDRLGCFNFRNAFDLDAALQKIRYNGVPPPTRGELERRRRRRLFGRQEDQRDRHEAHRARRRSATRGRRLFRRDVEFAGERSFAELRMMRVDKFIAQWASRIFQIEHIERACFLVIGVTVCVVLAGLIVLAPRS